MKKIIAILVSFLFVASTLSFASATVDFDSSSIDCCDPANFHIDKTSVKVGETFTTYYYKSWMGGCTPTIISGADLVEKIRVNEYKNGQLYRSFDLTKGEVFHGVAGESYLEEVYRAVKPGKVVFSVPNTFNCNGKVEVTITSRALPMDKFFKLFGFGKKD